jgi:hypothetical protein
VDAVAVKINDDPPVPLSKEDGHVEDDCVWSADVPSAKEGARYQYLSKFDKEELEEKEEAKERIPKQ